MNVVLFYFLLFKVHDFRKLSLRKLINIAVTRSYISKLKCTKLDFGWGSALNPAGEDYSAPPDPLAGFKGSAVMEREERV